jgi:predicted dienelactone hydrolase
VPDTFLLVIHAQLALIGLAPLLAQSGAPASPAPLLGPGPFAVGFRSAWAFDEGRTYRTAFDEGKTYGSEKTARPLLVLQWYPAQTGGGTGEPLPHGRYFAIPSEDPRLERYAGALAEYARGVFVAQVMGEPETALDEDERAALEAALAAPTLSRPGLEPASGSFPLVIYHSGAGSSFEDNAALCEHLASHGYVVLGSAYPEADGSSLGVDAGRGSAEDVQFLARWARRLPFAD